MQHANDNYNHFNCTENHYFHPLFQLLYTDGIKQLAADCSAYWLIDLVFSHQLSKKVKREPFQVWKLQRAKDNVFKIVADDGNGRIIAKQQIPFSDFKYDSCTLWLVDGCLLLPSEY